MFGADVVGRKQAKKRSTLRSNFDGGAAVRFLALDDADHGGDNHSGFAGCLDGVDGGGAGGADVVHDDHAGAGLVEAFNAAAGAVGLLGLADEETVEQWCGGAGKRAPCAGGGHVGDDGVRAQGESADGFGGATPGCACALTRAVTFGAIRTWKRAG